LLAIQLKQGSEEWAGRAGGLEELEQVIAVTKPLTESDERIEAAVLAAIFGCCSACSGDGSGGGPADAAEAIGRGEGKDGWRLDDAAGDAAFQYQVTVRGRMQKIDWRRGWRLCVCGHMALLSATLRGAGDRVEWWTLSILNAAETGFGSEHIGSPGHVTKPAVHPACG
jgi:hypothetical protein